MAWVLWDIFIPLVASFALGTLLGWAIWNWHRQKRDGANDSLHGGVVVNEEASDVSGNQQIANATEDESEVAIQASVQQPVTDTTAMADNLAGMEQANTVLIGERDRAVEEMEEIQQEAEALRQRIAELEADAADASVADAQLNDEITDSENRDAGDSLTDPLITAVDNSEELALLQDDIQQLTETLERERKARRATELELLNIKNQHDKLANELQLAVSQSDHTIALQDRDTRIHTLEQQLADQADQHHQLNRELARDVAVVFEPEPEPEDEIAESAVLFSSESKDSADRCETDAPEESDDCALTVDSQSVIDEDLSAHATAEVASQTPCKNGHIPKGWAIPDNPPTGKDRDSLTEIKGVGPVLEKMLHDCGIYYFHQMAELDESGMEELQLLIPQFPGRIKRDKWVEQARVLQRDKYGEPV